MVTSTKNPFWSGKSYFSTVELGYKFCFDAINNEKSIDQHNKDTNLHFYLFTLFIIIIIYLFIWVGGWMLIAISYFD